MSQKSISSNINIPPKKKKNFKVGGAFISLLPLYACGGGGGDGNPAPTQNTPGPVPTPAPIPDFLETSLNVFVARDNTNFLTLEKSSATADLTVTGKEGLDNINTGSGNDTINGGGSNDTINSGDGDDIINGDGGSDIINSGAGNDFVQGGTGADYINGGAGADILDGGNIPDGYAQSDRIVYKTSSSGVNVNITTNVVSGGDAEGDIISNFEGIVGSDFDDVLVGLDNFDDGSSIRGEGGNDIIIGGNGTTNFLYGGEGIDTITGGNNGNVIEGGPGADILDGGSSVSDRVSYSQSPQSVIVDLSTNTVSGGDADGDTIINFERAEGSFFNDTLIASPLGSSLRGLNGNDTLIGDIGSDSLIAGSGADNLNGGAGNDYISIYVNDSATEDVVDGGTGIDRLSVSNAAITNDFTLDVSRLDAQNIEILLMNGSGSNSIVEMNITLQDVIDITDAGNELRIEEGFFQSSEVNSLGQGWVQGADQIIDGETYDTYTAAGASLLIDEDIIQNIS